MRLQVPRHVHANWSPAPDRADPLNLLQAQDEDRLMELVPLKYGRMLASPFAFLRGSAAVMAADLATTPATEIEVVLCGDAHLSNFGVFATPERRLVFDVNDFDEAYPGPWEWDLKRLATSVVVAGRENGYSEKKCRQMALKTVETYQKSMRRFSRMSTTDIWYYHVNADDVLDVFEETSKKGHKSAQKMVKKARSRTHEQTLEELTHFEEGKRRINSEPPLLVPLREMDDIQIMDMSDRERLSERMVESAWRGYLDSLPDERRFLLERFRIIDVALRVGGVGSVGTRCSIALLQGEAEDDVLLLQLKEAGPSALEAYLPKAHYGQHAERVVTGQRLIQATSDIFLGWHTSELTEREYYWRQLKDMKGSADVTTMDEDGFQTYVAVCSLCLARAHARTGDEAAISGYIGRNDTFARAIADFAVAYADQTERDHQGLLDKVKSGQITAKIE